MNKSKVMRFTSTLKLAFDSGFFAHFSFLFKSHLTDPVPSLQVPVILCLETMDDLLKTEAWMPQEAREYRVEIASKMPTILNSIHLFSQTKFHYSYVHNGNSSVVVKVVTPGCDFIVKFPRNNTLSAEMMFLSAWKNIGVDTINILERGVFANHEYFIQEFVSDQLLSSLDPSYVLEQGSVYKMGTQLRLMHTCESVGYGAPDIYCKGANPSFNQWLNTPVIQNEIASLLNCRSQLPVKFIEAFVEAKIWLSQCFDRIDKTAFCHMDYSLDNVFCSKSIKVFDPHAVLTHPYFDVARTIVLFAVHFEDLIAPVKLFTKGYFDCDYIDTRTKTMITRAIIFEMGRKFGFWVQCQRHNRIKRILDFLDSGSDSLFN